MSDSIQVAIKVRPLIKREKDENLQIQWEVQKNVITPLDSELKKRSDNGFQFDHIFDAEKKNIEVFNTVVRPIVEAAVNGFNGTVFAYGQTSSGKTHTMIGTDTEPGIIPLAIEHMFDTISQTHGREFLLRVSYYEIYNEKVNDLLNVDNQDLKLFEDNNGLVSVLKSKEEVTSTPENILEIMKKGDKNRRVGETDMNERSSRSHTIFRVTIESREISSDSDGAVQVSQLNLVDLAGSERARQTNATGERFKEGTHINLSLSTLGLVIKQLSESAENQKTYINFRDSKLTRLLQASLGGNAMTVMICAVTPAAYEETQCTLSFASRAKSVKNKPQLNEVMSDAVLLKRYKKQLSKLTTELEKIRSEKGRSAEVEVMETMLQEKEHKLQEKDKMNQLLEERIELIKNAILGGDINIKTESNLKKSKSQRRRTWAGGKAMHSRFSTDPKNLPTIEENSTNLFSDLKNKDSHTSDDHIALKPKKCYFQSRKSIIQTVDLNTQKFETEFADFELDLIENAKERDAELSFLELDEQKCRSEPRVKFQDKVEIYRLSSDSTISTNDKENSSFSQDMNKTCNGSESPGTPKSKLRERLHELSEDYRVLQEFTTLEKQCMTEEQLQSISHVKKIDELIHEIEKYKLCQNTSLMCINTLVSLLPNIFNSWKPIHFSDCDSEQEDIINDLEKLQELLITLRIEDNANSKHQMSELEKKLTDELKLLTNEKESLLHKNNVMKSKLEEESKKLKNNEVLVNTLSVDTDHLMMNLLKKDSELAKLKERVKQLERIAEEKKSSNSIENDCPSEIDNMNKTIDLHIQKLTDEISTLNETISEKDIEISKLMEGNIKQKTDYELLQKEHQKNISDLNKIIDELNNEITKYKDSEDTQREVQEQQQKISDLSKIIDDLNSEVTKYKNSEDEHKKEYELLQESLASIKSSQEDSSKLLEESSFEIAKYKELVQNLQNEIKNLNESLSKAILNNEINSNQYEQETELQNKISLLEQSEITLHDMIKDKDTHINTLEKNQSYMTSEIQKLQDSKKMAYNLEEKMLTLLKNSTIDFEDFLDVEKKMQEEIEHFHNYLQIVKEMEQKLQISLNKKSDEIKEFKDSEIKLQNEIQNLKNSLEQTVVSKTNLSELVEKYELEMSNQQNIKEELENKVETLKQSLEFMSKTEQNEISIFDEKSEELKKYQELEEKLQNEIQHLRESLDLQIKTENDLTKTIESYKLEEKEYQQTIEKLKNTISYLELNAKPEKSVNEINESMIKDISSDLLTSEINDENSFEKVKKLEDYCKQLEYEVESLRTQVKNARCLNSDEIIKVKSDAGTQLQDNLDNNMEHYQKDINDLKSHIESLQQTLETVTKSEKNLLLTIEEKSQVIDKYKESEEKLLNKIEILKKSAEATQELEKNLSVLIEEKKSEAKKYEELEKQLRTEIKDAQESLDIITESEQNLTRIVDEKTLEISNLKKLREKLNDEIKNLKISLESHLQKDKLPQISEESFCSTEVNSKIEDLVKILDEKSYQILKYKENEEKFREDIKCLNLTLLEYQEKILLSENQKVEKETQTAFEQIEDEDKMDLICDTTSNTIHDLINVIEPENLRTSIETQTENSEIFSIINENVIKSLLESIKAWQNEFQDENKISEINKIIFSIKSLLDEVQKNNKSLNFETEKSLLLSQNSSKGSDLKLELESSSIFANESYFSNFAQMDYTENLDHTSQIIDISLNSKSFKENKRTPLKIKQENVAPKLSCEKLDIKNKKIIEEINTSLSLDTTLNNSNYEGMNMTVIEEQVQNLHSELKELKENHNKLSNQYTQKCNEIDSLHIDNTIHNNSFAAIREDQNNCLKSESPRNKKTSRIHRLHKKLDEVKNDIQELKKSNANINSDLQTIITAKKVAQTENSQLKIVIDELKNKLNVAQESQKSFEDEVNILKKNLCNLTKELETTNTEKINLQSRICETENLLENLKKEKDELQSLLNEKSKINYTEELENLKSVNIELENKLSSSENKCSISEEKISILDEQLKNFQIFKEEILVREQEINLQKAEIQSQLENLTEQNLSLQNFVDTQKQDFENKIAESTSKLHEFEKEKINLQNEIIKLTDTIKLLEEKLMNVNENNSDKEVHALKKQMLTEIKTFKKLNVTELEELTVKPINKIYEALVSIIMSLEKDVVKKIQNEFSKEKRKLEDQKQQATDAQKRTNDWAKTLETDLEKLHDDLSKQEHLNKSLKEKNCNLEENFKEICFENEKLKQNISNLESEIKVIQIEMDKKLKSNVIQDHEHDVQHQKEQFAKNLEAELETQLEIMKENYQRKIIELQEKLEYLTSSNEDMKNTIEGLELNADQMKNIINMKNSEIESLLLKINNVQKEVQDQEDTQQQLKNEISEKSKKIDEITDLLKHKCDTLNEYKTKVEIMKPENENLQEKIREKNLTIDKLKEDIINLKSETKKQLQSMQDKLSDEEIKLEGLKKQLSESSNINSTLTGTLQEIRVRLDESELENHDLRVKMTSLFNKTNDNSELQKLIDENRSLKNELENTYTRIKELQNSKSLLQHQFIDLQGKHTIQSQEINSLNTALEACREKINSNSMQKLKSDYDELLQEKKKIKLELEEKKMMLANKDQILSQNVLDSNDMKLKNQRLSQELEITEKKLKKKERELNLLKDEITNLKSEKSKLELQINDSSFILQDNKGFKILLEEKSKIATDLDNCMKQKNKKVEELNEKIKEKDNTIKELNNEMDELVEHIHKQESEIADLMDKMITGSHGDDIMEKLRNFETENEKLKIEVRVGEVKRKQLENDILKFIGEKEVLNSQINKLEDKISDLETKLNSSKNSSKNSSPATVKSKRRQRRSDLYNQNRNIGEDNDESSADSRSTTPIENSKIQLIDEECNKCNELRNNIHGISSEIAEYQNKIKLLEEQIEKEKHPYKIKCEQLNQKLLSYKSLVAELNNKNLRLENIFKENSSRNCLVCENWKNNKRNQGTQCEREKIGMSGMSSGIVQEQLNQEKIEKLENNMKLLKNLCKDRNKRIKELEKLLEVN